MIKVDQYRDIWLSEKFDEVIGFYPREFYPLDNFSSFKVEYNGYLYASAEEAFQANLFIKDYPEIADMIKNSHSAHEAQKIRFKYEDKITLSEEEILELMENILRCKINQNPYVKKKLLETKNYMIVEDSPKDNYWGWGSNRDGQNKLGNLWMKLRKELIDKYMEKITIGKKKENTNYKFRETCFGIVDKDDEFYITAKNGEPSLIGGGVEEGETHLETLKREFMEEAGLTIEECNEFITIDCFWVTQNNEDMESLANFYITKISNDIVDNTEKESKLVKVKKKELIKILPLPYQKKAIELYLKD